MILQDPSARASGDGQNLAEAALFEQSSRLTLPWWAPDVGADCAVDRALTRADLRVPVR